MPPEEIPAIPLPTTLGKDAYDYLNSYSMVPVIPSVRSSDDELVRRDPFLYYLVRRLGLTDPTHLSIASSRGSWFHTRLQNFAHPPETIDILRESLVNARCGELKTILGARRLSAPAIDERLESERRDAKTAWGWFECAMNLPIPCENAAFRNGIAAFLRSPAIQILGHEVDLSYEDPEYPGTPLHIKLDMLLYSHATNEVYIFDAKTTSYPTTLYTSTVPFKFQTLLYPHVLQALLKNGQLRKMYPVLPTNVAYGGMYHGCIQKPTIEMSGYDRDWTIDNTPFKSGPRKGQPKGEKVYDGDPKLENYIKRIERWYLATEEFLHYRERRVTEPVVNMCFTSPSLSNSLDDAFRARLTAIHELATRTPYPCHFPRTGDGMADPFSKRLTKYARFYSFPPAYWPTIVQQEGLVISHRNPIDTDVQPL